MTTNMIVQKNKKVISNKDNDSLKKIRPIKKFNSSSRTRTLQKCQKKKLQSNFRQPEGENFISNYNYKTFKKPGLSKDNLDKINPSNQIFTNSNSEIFKSYLKESTKTEQRLSKYLNSDLVMPKLHKLLAECNVGTSKDVEELVISGRISVNGEPAHIGQRIRQNDLIKINGRPIFRIKERKLPRFILYNRTLDSKEYFNKKGPCNLNMATIHLPKLRYGRWNCIGFPNFDLEGLLVFTDSSDITRRIILPRCKVDREYLLCISNEISLEEQEFLLKNHLEKDIEITFVNSVDLIGQDASGYWYRLVLMESRNQEVGKLLKKLNLQITRIICTRLGNIVLPENLFPRKWKELDANLSKALMVQMGLLHISRNNLSERKYFSKQPNSHDSGLPSGFEKNKTNRNLKNIKLYPTEKPTHSHWKNFSSRSNSRSISNESFVVTGGYANGHPLERNKSHDLRKCSKNSPRKFFSKTKLPNFPRSECKYNISQNGKNEGFFHKRSNSNSSSLDFKKKHPNKELRNNNSKVSKIKKNTKNEFNSSQVRKKTYSDQQSIVKKKKFSCDENRQPNSSSAHKSCLGFYKKSNWKKL